jgi:hypothetical protein
MKKEIDRQFVGGVHEGVNVVVSTLEMKQNQDNCSGVRKFVRTRSVHVVSINRSKRQHDIRSPPECCTGGDAGRSVARGVPRRRVPEESRLLLRDGCCRRLKQKARSVSPTVGPPLVFVKKLSRHGRQRFAQCFEGILVELHDDLPSQTREHCKNCLSRTFRRVWCAHGPG